MALYVADSNFFIQAHRMHYPMDIMPTFWRQVKALADAGTLVSIDKVRDEIYRNKDGLTDWCFTNLHDGFFVDTESAILQYIEVVEWANSRRGHYKPTAIDEFLNADEADAWLVAYALSNKNQHVLVTHETRQPQRTSKIKIPDVCEPFGVRYLNTITMFRELGVRF